MKLSDLGTSNYLVQSDVEPPIILTIKSEAAKDFAKDGNPPEMKLVLGFNETQKEFACNKTNFKRIRQLLKENDSTDWIGKQICLWFNEDVEFKGDVVGGIRVRQAPSQPVASDQPPIAPPADIDQDIPF